MDNRARRQHKTVDYAALLDGDDSDDDFVASSAKPKADVTKLKIKMSNADKTRHDNEVAEFTVATDSPLDAKPSKKSRLSRDEKMYQRDLEQALKLSVNEEFSLSEPDLDVHNQSSQDTVLLSLEEVVREEVVTTTPFCPSPATEEPLKPSPKPQTKLPKQRSPRGQRDQDSESESDAAVDLDDSYSEDEPEVKPAKTKTAKPARKKTKAEVKVAPKAATSISKPPASVLKPATTNMGLSVKTPVWNPPNHTKDSKPPSSPAVSSSATGLRLGLSRKARVKPLHPGVQLKI